MGEDVGRTEQMNLCVGDWKNVRSYTRRIGVRRGDCCAWKGFYYA